MSFVTVYVYDVVLPYTGSLQHWSRSFFSTRLQGISCVIQSGSRSAYALFESLEIGFVHNWFSNVLYSAYILWDISAYHSTKDDRVFLNFERGKLYCCRASVFLPSLMDTTLRFFGFLFQTEAVWKLKSYGTDWLLLNGVLHPMNLKDFARWRNRFSFIFSFI